jgi:hypothetical protein
MTLSHPPARREAVARQMTGQDQRVAAAFHAVERAWQRRCPRRVQMLRRVRMLSLLERYR